MLLNNVALVNDHRHVNIAITGEKITAINTGNIPAGTDHFQLHFTEAVALPGLINSHDHLDFNCFSPLGNKKYNNYTEWGNHIHKAYTKDIDAVLKIPATLRISWGMYKNLLAGITTVVNHGPHLKINNPLINIYQDTQNLHSVKFQRKWKWKLNNPFLRKKPCVIHTGEGVDEQSHHEIDELLKYNLLKRKLIGVHGVAMNATQAKRFSGLIWCPESNRVLLNKHARIEQLKASTRLVFGTDSTLTGNWDIWDHLRLARTLKQVNDAELFEMVTSSPAKLWGMNNGQLLPGKDADIVVATNSNVSWSALFGIRPEDILMIIYKGKIRMFDKSIHVQLRNLNADLSHYSRVCINGIVKFIEGDLPALMAAIWRYNPDIVFPFDVCEDIKNPAND